MKINLLKYIVFFFSVLVLVIIYLSLIGLETQKFNKQIKHKIIKNNKNLNIELKKVKLTLDPINFKINAKTVGATIFYSNRPLPLEYIKTELSLSSLLYYL